MQLHCVEATQLGPRCALCKAALKVMDLSQGQFSGRGTIGCQQSRRRHRLVANYPRTCGPPRMMELYGRLRPSSMDRIGQIPQPGYISVVIYAKWVFDSS